ncbi:hypothetical protein BDP27DRAFT_1366920 [Rhodocollybia butyracea]|uniref:Uncharacterized protein n=1 Tax=Rhodocollybia butyracea TaxID=206335 RepID=A0A9P5PFQ1_9AGAR|nr:hypothetical protein BDP27DRAFT_1366920 [Rhodocollybia butyracea]
MAKEDSYGCGREIHTHQTMKKKNVITPEMCMCIMDLVEEGASPEKVNNIIHSVGKSLGIEVTDDISGRTARRVVDTNEKMTLFLGISLAPGHTSEEQLQGWVDTIDGMHNTYAASPTGQKNPLDKCNFYLKVIRMLTDHAADQKKLFALFWALKEKMEHEVWGEQALKGIAPDDVVRIALDYSTAAVQAAGGAIAWDALPDKDQAAHNAEVTIAIITHFGQEDFDKLTSEQKAEVDFCIW